jgi:hypothetical protein
MALFSELDSLSTYTTTTVFGFLELFWQLNVRLVPGFGRSLVAG